MSLEALLHFLPVDRRRQEVATGAKVLSDRPIRREEALRVSRRFEPLHPSFTLTSRPVGVLAPVIEVAALPMLHARHHLAFGSSVAFQLVRDQHAGHIAQAFEQLFEELLGRLLVASALD